MFGAVTLARPVSGLVGARDSGGTAATEERRHHQEEDNGGDDAAQHRHNQHEVRVEIIVNLPEKYHIMDILASMFCTNLMKNLIEGILISFLAAELICPQLFHLTED